MDNSKSNNKAPKNNKETPQKVVALSYQIDEEAPKVTASGQGYIADKILDIAKDKNIPLYKNEQLVEQLSSLEIGEYIPAELYEVVAQILVFVSDMDKLKSMKTGD